MAFTSFQRLTAAALNDLLAPGWDIYTPIWSCVTTAPALGNGTLTGRWRRPSGSDLIDVEIRFVGGSTSTYGSGDWKFSLPVAAASSVVGAGAATLLNSGVLAYCATVSTFLTLTDVNISSPTGGVASGVPFAWGTADELRLSYRYQPAS